MTGQFWTVAELYFYAQLKVKIYLRNILVE